MNEARFVSPAPSLSHVSLLLWCARGLSCHASSPYAPGMLAIHLSRRFDRLRETGLLAHAQEVPQQSIL